MKIKVESKELTDLLSGISLDCENEECEGFTKIIDTSISNGDGTYTVSITRSFIDCISGKRPGFSYTLRYSEPVEIPIEDFYRMCCVPDELIEEYVEELGSVIKDDMNAD